MRKLQTRNDRMKSICMLVLCPAVLVVLFVAVELGIAPGIAAGHPPEYLKGTCIVVALVSIILPVLSLMEVIVLPNWFLAMV